MPNMMLLYEREPHMLSALGRGTPFQILQTPNNALRLDRDFWRERG
jgi:hypothetical protein